MSTAKLSVRQLRQLASTRMFARLAERTAVLYQRSIFGALSTRSKSRAEPIRLGLSGRSGNRALLVPISDQHIGKVSPIRRQTFDLVRLTAAPNLSLTMQKHFELTWIVDWRHLAMVSVRCQNLLGQLDVASVYVHRSGDVKVCPKVDIKIYGKPFLQERK